VPRRKPFPEKTFWLVEVRRAGLEVLRGAAKFDPVVKRISVHNVIAEQ
jgi:hypothetical protein